MKVMDTFLTLQNPYFPFGDEYIFPIIIVTFLHILGTIFK